MATLCDLSFPHFPAEMGASGQLRFLVAANCISPHRDKTETEAKLVKPTACRGFKTDVLQARRKILQSNCGV